MLTKRIATALVLVPAVILGVLFLSPSWFSLIMGLVACIASWEYCKLIKLNGFSNKSFYIIVVLSIAFLLAISPSILKPALFLVCAWWLGALFVVVSFPKSSALLNNNIVLSLVNGLFLLAPMLSSLAILQSQEKALVLLLLFYIWAADIGAYFSGRRFGRKKLCPEVSPKKTFEGVYGGILLSQIVAILYVVFAVQGPKINDFLVFCFLALVVSLVSVIGDLFESVLKRMNNQKDSGSLLPGHGGLLDRIDSLTVSAPMFLLLVVFVL
jgi:phosphatidate cytidylyltransferase